MPATLTIEDPDIPLRASVRFDRWDGFDGKAQYAWEIETMGPWLSASVRAQGSDLRIPARGVGASVGSGHSIDAEALASLLSFLRAYVDSVQYEKRNPELAPVEGTNMFPASLRPWAEVISSDAIAMLRIETFGEES